MNTNRRNFIKGAGVAGATLAVNSAQVLGSSTAQAAQSRWSSGIPTSMSFCTLMQNGESRLGIKTKGGILDVQQAVKRYALAAPDTLGQVLQSGGGGELAALIEKARDDRDAPRFKEDEVSFGPCVAAPEKIIMLGLNYRKHAEELKMPVSTTPILFNKYNNSLMSHRGVLKLPTAVAAKFDYEVELVIVMGKTTSNVSESEALSHVFGYCVGNDFSARDLQTRTSQFMLGKSCDGFAPIGPYLVTADLVPDPNKLALSCLVNGQVRQSSNTSDMVFDCKTMISYISRHLTMKPGDIIFTGTPEGVIAGYPKDKQVWLRAGDEIVSRIEHLGELKFTLA